MRDVLLALQAIVSVTSGGSEIAKFVPLDVSLGDGAQAKLQVFVPTKGELSISNAEDLYEHVLPSWEQVVETHTAGLSDPKQSASLPAGLSSGEAWHHYTAAQDGVVDSARFLITFSLVPSVQTGGSPLHIAASLGHLDTVQRLLDSGARVDERKEDGTTALHCAATMGHVKIVELLLEEEADPEAAGKSGATALMMAAAMGHVEVVMALLAGGAEPDTRHVFGKTTALHLAAEVGRLEVVRQLCRAGADVEAEKVTGGSALHTAADANMTGAVTVLVEHCGANINKLLMGDTTPLYLAAQRGYTEVVRELLRLGAQVNFVMPQGRHGGHLISLTSEGSVGGHYPVKNTEVGNGATALHAAVENGHLETARELLAGGALQTDSMEGATPLVIALQYRHPHIALLLLEDGWPDPRLDCQVPSDGSSALFVAAGYGYLEVVQRLVERGAQLSLTNTRGATPLSFAISRRQQEIVRLLVEAGAVTGPDMTALHSAVQTRSLALVTKVLARSEDSVNVAGPDDQTPLHLAAGGPVTIVRALLGAGAEVNSLVRSSQATVLHMAALAGNTEVVRVLLDWGARLQPRAGRSLYGATPLYLAAQNGHSDTVEALLSRGADINCRLRKIGATPLFISAERGHSELVTLLLEQGATPHARNWNGLTALGVAALASRRNIVQQLIEAGAEVNSRDSEGLSLLANCVDTDPATSPQCSLQVLSDLLKAGADPNIRSNSQTFPLLLLARKEVKKDKDLVTKYARLLLEAGANVNQVKTEDGSEHSALSAATQTGHVRLVETLLSAGAETYLRMADGLTPLGHVIKHKQTELVKLFLKHGAECCIHREDPQTSNCGELCLQLAVGSRNSDIIELITKHIGNSRKFQDEL